MSSLDICQKKIIKEMKKKYENMDQLDVTISNGKLKELKNFLKYSKTRNKIHLNHKKVNLRGTSIILDEGVVLRNNRSTYFSFTEPIVFPNNEGNFIRNYKTISPGDKLFVWVTYNREGAEHVVVQIQSRDRQRNISFGFGYAGNYDSDNKAYSKVQKIRNVVAGISKYTPKFLGIRREEIERHQGSIYTPDYLFELRLKQQILKPKQSFLKLIVSAILTQENVDAINLQFDLIENIQKNLIALPIYQVKPDAPVFYMGNHVKFPDLQYCTWTEDGITSETNCAGFVEHLFDKILSCKGYLGGLFTSHYNPAPENCTQISKVESCDIEDEVIPVKPTSFQFISYKSPRKISPKQVKRLSPKINVFQYYF